MQRNKPSLVEEMDVLQRGFDLVIGVDEVGRGAFAGPIVAGAVCMGGSETLSRCQPLCQVPSAWTACLPTAKSSPRYPEMKKNEVDWLGLGIDDSKRLSAKKREVLSLIIKENCLWGIGEVSVAYINRYGIVKANEKAMRSSIANLKFKIENSKFRKNLKIFLLLDAFYVKHVKSIGLKNQKAITKGDQISISIASASIIAKVHRDKLMCELGKKFAKYKWEINKGYGTLFHRQAVKKYGITKYHRKVFVSKTIQTID